jgi:transcriptional regulator with XRE-family HTH domain
MPFNTLVMSNPYRMLTTGLRIKKLRELRGYSQSYMARKLGISQEQYSYLETKQKSIPGEQVRVIAALLEVDEELLRNFDPLQVLAGSEDRHHGLTEIQTRLIQNHENERKLFLELINRLTEELTSLKQKFKA